MSRRVIRHGGGKEHLEGESCPHCQGFTTAVARSSAGGSVLLQATALHARECPNWRMGNRHGPCRCGAYDLWEQMREQLAVEVLDR